MAIYTKKGDRGKTSLLGSKRKVRKDSPRITAYGTVDELQAQLGFAESLIKQQINSKNWKTKNRKHIRRIQQDLFEIEAELATPQSHKPPVTLPAKRVKELERLIDDLEGKLPVLSNFIFPGGAPAAAALHVSRTVCRRAEREVVRLSRRQKVNPDILMYLNRLSDALFMLAREVNRGEGAREEIWER